MPVIKGLRYRSCSQTEGCLEGATAESGAFLRVRERPVQLRIGDVVVFETTAATNELGAFSVTPTSAGELLFRRVTLTGRTINGHLYANGTGFGTWLDSGGASGRWSATRQAR